MTPPSVTCRALLSRVTVIAAVATGITGGVVGLVIGLVVNAPTAPFAVLEVGLPSAFAGALAGFAAGVTVLALRRLRRRGRRAS